MKGCDKISYLIILFIIFPFVLSYPQGQQYKFEHITTEQGLSQNMTKCIFQDSKGFIWIGTSRGLNRYDGNKFKIYTSNQDSTSLTGAVIQEIFEDRDGNIWVGTKYSGLNLYNRGLDNFKRFKPDPDNSTSLSHNHVKSICQDKEGTIWIGTYGGGLNKFDSKSETFSVYKQFPDQPDHFVDRIYDLYEDNTGVFWIGTETGLFTFDRVNDTFHTFDFDLDIPPLQKVFQCIYQDENNILWFGSYAGLIKYNNDTREVALYLSKDDDHHPIECITGSKSGDDNFLWIGTTRGLKKLDVGRKKFTRIFQDTSDPFSLSGNYITDLCLDNTGNLWIATWRSGLNKLQIQKNHFQQYFLESD